MKAEIFSKDNKKKMILNKISSEGTTQIIMVATKIGTYNEGDHKYLVNIYKDENGAKTAVLNQEMGIIVDPQNLLRSNNMNELFLLALATNIDITTYNGKESVHLTSTGLATGRLMFATNTEEAYFDKETGLIIASMAYDTTMSDNKTTRMPFTETKYEFGTVTDENLTEPDVTEYEIAK